MIKDEEFVPDWIYANGRRISKDLWDIEGIHFRVMWDKQLLGYSLRLVPDRLIDKIRAFGMQLPGRN